LALPAAGLHLALSAQPAKNTVSRRWRYHQSGYHPKKEVGGTIYGVTIQRKKLEEPSMGSSSEEGGGTNDGVIIQRRWTYH
jgi:hypothetical protein